MKDKRRFLRLELLSAMVVLVILVGVISIQMVDFSNNGEAPKFSSFVSASSISQNLDLELYQSQAFVLSSDEVFGFTSFRLSGFIEGQGPAQIYLENDRGEMLLVYTNIKEKTGAGDLVTGFASDDGQANQDVSSSFTFVQDGVLPELNLEIPEDYELIEGSFYDECSETCFIDSVFYQDTNYRLVFYIGENVGLRANKLVYTKN
jgi:hypothetical protein